MPTYIPYCGTPPTPLTLAERWNGDPVLLAALVLLAFLHYRTSGPDGRSLAMIGWAVAAFAFLSPLCALSVSLFAARVGQHMLLMMVAAPLIGGAIPGLASREGLWSSAGAFAAVLWFWHMPVPYDATFRSDFVYWAMHGTLFGAGIWLWRELLQHRSDHAFHAIVVGVVTTVQMSMLGAILTLGGHPLFSSHLATSQQWGLTPLADQQWGGILMWVPGCILFLWVAVRSTRMLTVAMTKEQVA